MPAADNASLHYFLQDDLYLLNEDKALYAQQNGQNIYLETNKTQFNYLGGNKGHFLILVNYTGYEHMPEAHLKALESTLSRKNLSVEDVAILNLNVYPGSSSEEIIKFFSPKKVLILGANASFEGFNSSGFNVIEGSQDHLQLHTHSFDELTADRDKAKAFWEQMKNF